MEKHLWEFSFPGSIQYPRLVLSIFLGSHHHLYAKKETHTYIYIYRKSEGRHVRKRKLDQIKNKAKSYDTILFHPLSQVVRRSLSDDTHVFM